MFAWVGGLRIMDGKMHSGHRERLRERFLKTGFDGFEPHEILELILFYSQPRGDTNEIAHRLIDRFGSVRGVFDADEESLAEIKGVGTQSIVFLKLILQLAKAYDLSHSEFEQLDTSQKVRDYFYSSFKGVVKEQIQMVCLDDELRILGRHIISEGGLSIVPINIRKIVEICVKSNCEMIILAHNHPNGIAMPSKEDIVATKKLKTSLENIGVNLLDHVIVDKERAISMYDAGYFSTIR